MNASFRTAKRCHSLVRPHRSQLDDLSVFANADISTVLPLHFVAVEVLIADFELFTHSSCGDNFFNVATKEHSTGVA